MTRRVGASYLWIDSICIIQSGDDGRDWREESKRMFDYYQNALVTFAATTSESLLPDQHIFSDNGVKIPYRTRDNGTEAGHIFVHRSSYINQQYQSQIQDSELLSRGWVWQEYLLSSRVIWFTPAAVFFECRSRSPINEHGESITQRRQDGTAETLALIHKRYFALDSGSPEYLELRWYDMIETYSAMKFTEPKKDRLAALEGFTQEFKRTLESSYARQRSRWWRKSTKVLHCRCSAGLWMRQPHIDLLWEQASHRPHQRLQGFPTWSWTSIYAGVLWINRDIHKRSSRVEAETLFESRKWGVPAYSDFAVHDATNEEGIQYITMRTKILTVTVDVPLKDWEPKELYNIQYRPRGVNKLFRAVRSTRSGARLCGWASLERSRIESALDVLRDNEVDHDPSIDEGETIAMLISTTDWIADDFRGYYWYPWHKASNVLFVRQVEEQKYERIGVGVLFGKDVDVDWAEQEAQNITLV